MHRLIQDLNCDQHIAKAFATDPEVLFNEYGLEVKRAGAPARGYAESAHGTGGTSQSCQDEIPQASRLAWPRLVLAARRVRSMRIFAI